MELKQMVERVVDIRNARPSKYVRQRVQEAAQELSRAGDLQMRVELANEALMAFTSILYHADTDQRPANIDPVTWRLLVPAPWGSAGWRVWGLRSWEARVLRQILRIRCDTRKHVNLFDYNDALKSWHLNIGCYRTRTEALAYLKQYPITLEEWRKHADILVSQARNRMAKYRRRDG
jgi:hypothetical protein